MFRNNTPMSTTYKPVPDRSCGTCTLCCKVYAIPELEKPSGAWCNECTPGKGCGIWGKQPEQCSTFFCQWMYDATLGPLWKPDVSRFVMNIQEGVTLAVAVDPGHRHAWKREPYYSVFKKMALELFGKSMMIVVGDGVNKILVTPEDDIVIGRQQEKVTYSLRRDVHGPVTKWVAIIEPKAA
jgi:hypothetical protein